MKKTNVCILATLLLLLSSVTFCQGTVRSSIVRETSGFTVPFQKKSQWCWAASTQFVLNYYGVAIDQEDIVRRTYGYGLDGTGALANVTGTVFDITWNLNRYARDRKGREYLVRSMSGRGQPVAATLIDEITAGHPVLIGYQTTRGGGHTVVVIGVSYADGPDGPVVETVEVFDPRENGGVMVYRARDIMQAIQCYWYIRVV